MKISLTPDLQQWVQDKVKSGKYSSVSEVVREGLRLLDERDAEAAARLRLRDERLAELKEKIRVGIEASERGEVVDGEEFFAELEEDIRRIEAEMAQQEVAK